MLAKNLFHGRHSINGNEIYCRKLFETILISSANFIAREEKKKLRQTRAHIHELLACIRIYIMYLRKIGFLFGVCVLSVIHLSHRAVVQYFHRFDISKYKISLRSQMKIHLKFTLNFKRQPAMTICPIFLFSVDLFQEYLAIETRRHYHERMIARSQDQ